MSKIKSFFKDNYLIVLLLLVLVVLHIIVVRDLGFSYSLNSDDASYVQSGITFLESGTITMHGVISAQIMPGMTFLIAIFAFFLGKGTALMIGLKIFWFFMGIATVYYVYKIVRLFTNKQIMALIPCLFFLSPEYIWMNNLILTETPFILLFVLLVYHSFKLAKDKNMKDYIFIVIYYMLAVFIRPNIGLFPLF